MEEGRGQLLELFVRGELVRSPQRPCWWCSFNLNVAGGPGLHVCGMFKTVLHDAVFDPGVSRVSTEGAVGKTIFGKKYSTSVFLPVI